MKIINAFTILLFTFLLFSCGGDSCEDSQQLVVESSTLFASESNSANCNAYKNAWLAHIADCNAVAGISEEEIEALKCDCIDIYETLSTAANTYSTDPTSVNCQAYKAALQTVVDNGSCDDNGAYNSSLMALNC